MKRGKQMPNIIDYVKNIGNKTLEQLEFNEVDNLILSRFAYFPFDNIMEQDEVLTIKELSERFEKANIEEMEILWKDDIELFPLMGKSKRFGEMLATKYINKIDKIQEKQFSAITVLMPDDTIFISYRGTDYTLIGWKEDLYMTFKNHIESQKDAVKYLQIIAEKYPKKIRLGGHSKGGNLAIYAATFIEDEIKDRIINIYNNDGPGFNEEITKTKEYKKIIRKAHTYIPQSTIIGRLLNQEGEYSVVKSKQIGIMQHELYSWQIIDDKFEYLEDLTKQSKIAEKTIKGWMNSIEPQKRKQFIDVLFEMLSKTESETFIELKNNWRANSKTILSLYKKLDNETKQVINQTLIQLFRIAKNNIFEEISKEMNKEINLKLKI